MLNFILSIVSMFISVTMVTSQRAAPHPQVNTTSGLLIGTTLEQAHAFYSVPYGEEPIRFMRPIQASYRGELDVSLQDVILCNQMVFVPQPNTTKYQDDCLVLNIHVPSSVNLNQVQSSDLLPVMVFFHGGAFYIGAGTTPDLEGRFLSNSTKSVVVTINYRLDVLGFFAYEEGNVKYEGNQGLKDQQLALKWVQDNILQFGGDKNQVTLFGSSAGAQSVMFHLLSDISDPLFNRAIMQSNFAIINYPTPEETKPIIEALTEVLNCSGSTINCLLNATSKELVDAFPAVLSNIVSTSMSDFMEPYRPVIDGVEFTDQPLNLFRDGKWQKNKEVIIGTNTMEQAYSIVILQNPIRNEIEFRATTISALGSYYGPLGADEYVKYANASDLNFDYTELLGLETSDLYFTCPSRAMARYMAETAISQNQPTIYLYHYAHDPDNDADCLKITFPSGMCAYAYHTAEVVFLFNTASYLGYNNTENDLKVVNQMISFWGTFAHSGSPSADQNIWPSYNKQAQGDVDAWTNVVIKAPTSSLETGYRQSQCDFWDSVGYVTDDVTPVPITPTTSGVPATTQYTSGTDDVTSTLTTTSGTCSIIISSAINFVLVVMLFVAGYTLV